MESFADLLQRARIRHRTKISTDRLLLLLLMMLMLLLLMMMMLLLMLLMMIISILKMFASLLRERRRRRRIKLRHGNGSAPNLVAGFLNFLAFFPIPVFLAGFLNLYHTCFFLDLQFFHPSSFQERKSRSWSWQVPFTKG